MSETVEVREYYEKPNAEFPFGSWKKVVGGVVVVACGRWNGEGPPSPYWHGGPPFVVLESINVPWEGTNNE
jgi:hypothetical protein